MLSSKERFGALLKELRLSKGFTQEDFAELIEKSASAVGQLERGDIYPNYETLTKIIFALEADANLFFFREMSANTDIRDWTADAFLGMDENERREIGKFLAKLARVMQK